MSRHRLSIPYSPRLSRQASFVCGIPPIWMLARRSASDSFMPAAAFLTACMAKWNCNSSSRSFSARRRKNKERQFISSLLEHAADCGGEPGPVFRLQPQLPASRSCQAVEAGAAAELENAPFSRNRALLFQTMERRIQRSLVDAQDVPRNLLD